MISLILDSGLLAYLHTIHTYVHVLVVPTLLLHLLGLVWCYSILYATECKTVVVKGLSIYIYGKTALLDMVPITVKFPFIHACTCIPVLLHDDVIDQRHRPSGKSCTNPAVRAGNVTNAPNTSIYGYIN